MNIGLGQPPDSPIEPGAVVGQERSRSLTSRARWFLAPILLSLVLVLLLTALRANESASRARCNKTLRAIGISIHFYAGDHRGQMPPDIEALLVGMSITPEVFVCQSSRDHTAAGPTQE